MLSERNLTEKATKCMTGHIHVQYIYKANWTCMYDQYVFHVYEVSSTGDSIGWESRLRAAGAGLGGNVVVWGGKMI